MTYIMLKSHSSKYLRETLAVPVSFRLISTFNLIKGFRSLPEGAKRIKQTSMVFRTRFWLGFSLFNLFIVALLGTLMRYKIGFEFPHFSQKYIQYAHSHFAFAGWISHTIYTLLVYYLSQKTKAISLKPYTRLLSINLLCSYGMLISFFVYGYSTSSIVLSSGTIAVACFFAYYFLRDLRKTEEKSLDNNWLRAALWFNIVSSAGTIYLAYIMASRNFNENWYLAAVYFYLHFQYNGFFLFSCLGLALNALKNKFPEFPYSKTIFTLFFTSAIPAYFLSVLWAKIPFWLYAIVILAALVQLLGWMKVIVYLKKLKVQVSAPDKLSVYVFLFVILAFTIKLFLQLGSTFPIVAKLAFGFRPIVIAYLHLVLLAVITVFLLVYSYVQNLIQRNLLSALGFVLFLFGVFFNELVLAIQGIASFSYFVIPNVNETLFIVALLLSVGALFLFISQFKQKSKTESPST